MSRPSVVFMGSKPGSAVALDVMLSRQWDVRYVVVTRSTNHSWMSGETLEQAAERHGIAVITQRDLPRRHVDYVISYMYRNRVKPDVLRLAKRAAVNFHAAPLPEFGGWAFYNVAILEGAREYGCTCHHMDEGFDTGPLLQVNRFPIDPDRETAYSLERKAQREMVRLFLDFCALAETGGPLPSAPQDPALMRYLQREQFEALKEIPAGVSFDDLQRIARAFWYPPYQCAYLLVGGSKIEVVPEQVKQELAACLHADDLDDLRTVVARYISQEQSNE